MNVRPLLLLFLLQLSCQPVPCAHASRGDESTAARQTLIFQVMFTRPQHVTEAYLQVERLDQRLELELRDDGLLPEDVAWDGIWVGRAVGPYARYVNASLNVTADGIGERSIDLGLVRTDDQHRNVVSWRADVAETMANRSLVALAGPQFELIALTPLIATFGWLVALICLVASITRTRE